MFTTPKTKRGPSTLFNTPKKVPLKGLFSDGIWHCNCSPRLPAAHFQVKKEGPNKGRWFYTCQESQQETCGFFLWDTEAHPREMRAVIANTRSESEEDARTPVSITKKAPEAQPTPSKKVLVDPRTSDDDEFGDWSLSVEDEKKLVQAVETSDYALPAPETPRKVVKTAAFSTPSSKRKRDEEMLPTPMTGGRQTKTPMSNAIRDEDIFTTPSSKLKGGTWDGNERFHVGIRSPSQTPTPGRFRDATEPLGILGDKSQLTYDMSEEVMELLKGQNLDPDTSAKLQCLLNKHALKISGIAKGRDITRVALKSKDLKITELQQKITSLELEREMDKKIIRQLKNEATQSPQKRYGR